MDKTNRNMITFSRMSLNWENYLKGTRLAEEEKILN
jgi:hypothetical protein